MFYEITNAVLWTALGLLLGGISGIFVGRRQARQNELPPESVPQYFPANDQIDEAASRWAAAQGMPEAADLAARKLRLWLSLQDRRRGRMR